MKLVGVDIYYFQDALGSTWQVWKQGATKDEGEDEAQNWPSHTSDQGNCTSNIVSGRSVSDD